MCTCISYAFCLLVSAPKGRCTIPFPEVTSFDAIDSISDLPILVDFTSPTVSNVGL